MLTFQPLTKQFVGPRCFTTAQLVKTYKCRGSQVQLDCRINADTERDVGSRLRARASGDRIYRCSSVVQSVSRSTHEARCRPTLQPLLGDHSRRCRRLRARLRPPARPQGRPPGRPPRTPPCTPWTPHCPLRQSPAGVGRSHASNPSTCITSSFPAPPFVLPAVPPLAPTVPTGPGGALRGCVGNAPALDVAREPASPRTARLAPSARSRGPCQLALGVGRGGPGGSADASSVPLTRARGRYSRRQAAEDHNQHPQVVCTLNS